MARWIAGLALLASLPILTAQRVGMWQDETRLWQQAADASPGNLRPRVQLGVLAHRARRFDFAEWHYRRALTLSRLSHERAGCQLVAENLTLLALQTARWQDAEEWGRYTC